MSDDDENLRHARRHARHALEDFLSLRCEYRGTEEGLWHSLSHHLRHAVYRLDEEVGR